MEIPTLFDPRPVAHQTTVLPACLPVPGLGMLPVNAFVIAGTEPVLVDTGLAALREEFMTALASVVDPRELRWIWLSHMDADHIGNLAAVLQAAPQARVVTSFLGMGKMMLHGLPVDSVHLLEPGEQLVTGDRTLVALRPPYYDAPETAGFFDTTSRALFAADSFGALMQTPAYDARAIAPDELRHGMLTWSSIDAPWLSMVDRARFGATLRSIERLAPSTILSGHLPPARDMTCTLTGHLWTAYCTGGIATPDHDEIERLVAAAQTAGEPASASRMSG